MFECKLVSNGAEEVIQNFSYAIVISNNLVIHDQFVNSRLSLYFVGVNNISYKVPQSAEFLFFFVNNAQAVVFFCFPKACRGYVSILFVFFDVFACWFQKQFFI